MLSEPTRDRPETCLSELRLDRWCVGELAPAEREAVREHLAGCVGCRGRLASIESEQRSLADALPPLRRRPAHGRWSWGLGALGCAAAALLVFVITRGPEPGAHPPSPYPPESPQFIDAPSSRVKGDARLGFFVQRDGAVTRGQHGEHVRPGDALRFEVSTSAPVHIAVLSVDAAGTISVYHPFGAQTQQVDAGTGVLDTAVELDDTLGAETVFGVFCASTVQIDTLRAALERDPNDPQLPPGCRADRLQLRKVGR